jgi:hypothetical protein
MLVTQIIFSSAFYLPMKRAGIHVNDTDDNLCTKNKGTAKINSSAFHLASKRAGTLVSERYAWKARYLNPT